MSDKEAKMKLEDRYKDLGLDPKKVATAEKAGRAFLDACKECDLNVLADGADLLLQLKRPRGSHVVARIRRDPK